MTPIAQQTFKKRSANVTAYYTTPGIVYHRKRISSESRKYKRLVSHIIQNKEKHDLLEPIIVEIESFSDGVIVCFNSVNIVGQGRDEKEALQDFYNELVGTFAYLSKFKESDLQPDAAFQMDELGKILPTSRLKIEN